MERKWKFAPLLDIYARDNQKVVIIDSGREGERQIDAQKEICCFWKPKSIAWHSSAFCFRNTLEIACCMHAPWVESFQWSVTTHLLVKSIESLGLRSEGWGLMIGFALIAKQKQKFPCSCALVAVLRARKFCELQTLPADVAFKSYFTLLSRFASIHLKCRLFRLTFTKCAVC